MSTRADWVDRWPRATFVCIGSGPSLTAEDCEQVRAAGLPTIVTNTTFRMCPWADVLFAFDRKWWAHYLPEVKETFRGARIGWAPGLQSYGIPSLHDEKAWFTHFHNSGASAVSLAIAGGAARVILLGYDCQRTGGRAHWHADHPAPMGNARSIANWPQQFKNLARYAASRRVPIVNASRATALTHFPRVSLEDALAAHQVEATA